jgi:hypothetical protein
MAWQGDQFTILRQNTSRGNGSGRTPYSKYKGQRAMSNHDWNDASITPCPTGVPVQITYIPRGLPTYCTAEGTLIFGGKYIQLNDGNTETIETMVSWRHRPEPEIPTMVPSKAFPGRWWRYGNLVVSIPNSALETAIACLGKSQLGHWFYVEFDVTSCDFAGTHRSSQHYPTVAEAMAAAEEYIVATFGVEGLSDE